MSKDLEPTNNFSHLFNDLPADERKRLIPFLLEDEIRSIWRCKNKAIAAHKRLMKEFDEKTRRLKKELGKYE